MRTLLRAMAAVGVAAVLLAAQGPPVDAAEPGLESEFVAQVNAVRAGVGLPPLAVDGELTAVARAWSDRMASVGGISHNPGVGAQVHAPWTTVGENVGTGPELDGIMAAFVASPGHYENIVDPIFDYVGIGVTWGTDGRMYTTHVFMDLDGGTSAPPPATAPSSTAPTTTSTAAPAPPAPQPPAPTTPAPPPAAFAPARVATVLALVGALDAGVQ